MGQSLGDSEGDGPAAGRGAGASSAVLVGIAAGASSEEAAAAAGSELATGHPCRSRGRLTPPAGSGQGSKQPQ